jgi:capsid assembly protease
MNRRLPHLAQRLFNVPLAIQPAKAEIIMAALADRFGVTQLFSGNRQLAFDDDWGWDDSDRTQDPRPYDVVAGIGIIPIQGTLVAKLGTLRPYSGMTGYDGIRVNYLMAIEDPEVEAIALDIDSPGGEIANMFDLCDLIYGARGTKPVHAILNECAYSAAYAIASCADRITVPRTGGTGSIGTVVLHTDLTKSLDQEGIKVTLIRYGTRKMEGNPFEPLSDAARGRIQDDINVIGDMFVQLVSRNRGIPAETIRDLEAEVFLGAAGVSLGLADAVSSPEAAFEALAASL